MAYKLLSQSRKLNKRAEGLGGANKSRGVEFFQKKISGDGGRLLDPRVRALQSLKRFQC